MWWNYLNISKRRAVNAHRLLYKLTFPRNVNVDAGFEALLIPTLLNVQLSITLSRVLIFIEVQFLCSRPTLL